MGANHTSQLWVKVRLSVIFACYIFASGSLRADDIEIYLANASIQAVNPNILFVMDTSGSMSLPPVADILSGTPNPVAKIDQMKSALTQLISNLNAVNVGLMRFSAYQVKDIYQAGGPVLYPVRDIDAAVDPVVFSTISSANDDGVETPFGGVELGQEIISMVTDGFDCPTCRVNYFEPVEDGDDIILGDETDPVLAVLGADGDYLGLRFEVDVPKDAIIFSARVIFTAAPNDGSVKYSETLRMSHDWKKANYSAYPADTAPFVDGVQLDTSEPSLASDWHGRRKWNGDLNPGNNSDGYPIPTFVDGNQYSANVKWSIEWSTQQTDWDSGDHISYRFYRERVDTAPCTANCGTAPIIELVPGFTPPSIPQPDLCDAPICTANCGTAPIIELVPGFTPAPIPQPDVCAAPVCTANCGPAPIIELVPGFTPAPIPQPDVCAAPVCTANCGTAPIIELVPGFTPAPIPQPDICAAPVCIANCGTAPIIELEPGYTPAPIPQPDTCIPDGEGGEVCFPNDPIQPPDVPPVFGPDPAYIPSFDPPVCTPQPDIQPPDVPPVLGPDPAYIPVFDPPVCTPQPDIQPPDVPPVFGPDPTFIPVFDPPVCTPQPDIQPPDVPPVFGPDPSYIPVFDPPVCTPQPDIQPPDVPPVLGPDPAYIPVFTPTRDFPATAAIRNVHGLQSGTPPILEVIWIPDSSNQKVALRFDEVYVPQGATITAAFIEFETEASTAATSVDIQAEKVINSAPLVEASFNIGSRPLTSNSVDWDNIIDWTSDEDDHKTTPNIASIVEEVVAQGGWCAGNAMTFVLTGSGTRKFKSWDNDSGAVPRLKIRYDQNSAVGGCNTKQVISTMASAVDDIEEASPSHPSLPSGTIIENSSLDNINHLGLRFQGVDIPQGAIITNAYLLLTARDNENSVVNTTIKAVATDDMPAWSLVDFNVTSQPTVPNTAVWTQGEWDEKKSYKSVDISAVIQDVVNRADWNEGNSIGIITTSIGNLSDNHSAYSAAEDDFSRKPKLVIAYQTPFELGVRTVRDELTDLVAGLTATGSTPVSGVMAEAASYYRGEDVYFGQNRGFAPNDTQRRYYRTSHPESYSSGTVNLPQGCYDAESSIKECHGETISGSPSYQSPISDICQTNNIVLLSDGIPNNNFSETRSLIEPIIVGDGNVDDGFAGYSDCASSLDGIDCSLKLAEAISKEDQETSTFNGIQTVQTHTIGFDLAAGGAAADFLENLADAGQGSSYSANNAGSLIDVFEAIINSLERESRTFVSAGVSVNQANRLTHRDELYFGLFKPDTDTVWDGNLKRYRLINGVIHDAVPAVAVDADGRFNDLARSFWSVTADGDEVAEGGAASKLTTTRMVYSNLTSDPLTNDNNKVIETNVNILEADVSAIDAADRTTILRWARGIDAGGNARKEMGDALHSTPVVVSYDDGSADGNPQVFVGTNQGYLHAVATATGVENWSFIPKSLLQNLTLFQKNTVVSNHVYGVDGNLTIYHEDTDQDSRIDSGETAILYAGMRRGGRNYYAIDISERLSPKLQFIIQGGSGDYAELGQSWSRLTLGKIRLNGSDRKVIVFGGGYDTNQDNIGVHSTDSVGRTVFIADAVTGAKLWDARINSSDPISGTSAVSNLNNSIPADIKAVDMSGSGYIEHIYASDTGGQVFRFDIDNFGNSGAADLAVGGRLANLQTGALVEENNRRFYYAPDVSVIKRPTFRDFVAVSIGSGYRAHPVNNGANDKFYVIRDSWVLQNNSFPNLPGDLDEDNLADVSLTIGDTNSDNVSDALALIEDAISPNYGWKLDFLQTGEKVLAESITFNGKVIFTTYRPNLSGIGTGVCAAPEGSGRAYILNIIDGTPSIDTNTDGDLLDLTTGMPEDTTCGDRCLELGRGIPASGIVLFQPEGATICFGTQCFDSLLTFKGERLQRIKWRKRRAF